METSLSFYRHEITLRDDDLNNNDSSNNNNYDDDNNNKNKSTAVNPQAAWERLIMNGSVKKTTELAKLMRVGRALRTAKATHTLL